MTKAFTTITGGNLRDNTFFSERFDGHLTFTAAFIAAERLAGGYEMNLAETPLTSFTHHDEVGNIVFQRKKDDIPRNRYDAWLAATRN